LPENKTKPTNASVMENIDARAKEEQKEDCTVLMSLLGSVTGEEPVMWGPSIVGYGSYRYNYQSGRSGESFVTGFAIRAKEIVLYLTAESPQQGELLEQLGQHRMGASCLYFKRLKDLDLGVLEQLVRCALLELQRQHPQTNG
jgi:hypothetical protein